MKFLLFHQLIAAHLFYTRQQIDLIPSRIFSLSSLTWSTDSFANKGLCLPLPPAPVRSLSSHPCHWGPRPFSLLLFEQWCHFFDLPLSDQMVWSQERCWVSAATWPSCLALPPDLVVSICVYACCLQCFKRLRSWDVSKADWVGRSSSAELTPGHFWTSFIESINRWICFYLEFWFSFSKAGVKVQNSIVVGKNHEGKKDSVSIQTPAQAAAKMKLFFWQIEC